MKTKRIIACIISCILFMVCIPFTAVADENEKTIVYRAGGESNTSPNGKVYWTLFAYDDYSFAIDIISATTKYISGNYIRKIVYDYNFISLYDQWYCAYANGFLTYTNNYEELNVAYTNDTGDLFGKTIVKLYFTVNPDYLHDTYDIQVFDTNVSIDFSKSYIKQNYAEITYNNGSSTSKIKTDTDVSDIQKYIDEMEAENALLRQENTELKNRINLLATGTYGDVNGDQVVDVQDAQIILAYYTERDVAKKSVPDLVTFGLKFGKG